MSEEERNGVLVVVLSPSPSLPESKHSWVVPAHAHVDELILNEDSVFFVKRPNSICVNMEALPTCGKCHIHLSPETFLTTCEGEE